MKQKADHHLSFLAEKNDRSATNILKHLPSRHSIAPESASSRVNGEVKRPATHATTNGTNGAGEEDAAGESDDGAVDAEDLDFHKGVKMEEGTLAEGNQLQECESSIDFTVS